MKMLLQKEYKDFACIGGECPDTCCNGWIVYIDEESRAYYEKVDGEFGEELRSNIEGEGKKSHFRMRKDGFCPFLNEEKLCRIYRTLGEERMCFTCQTFPRIVDVVGELMIGTISLGCPEAARMLFSDEEIAVQEYGETAMEAGTYDEAFWDRYNNYIRIYTVAQMIAGEREYSIQERFSLILIFCRMAHEKMQSSEPIDELTGLFSDPAAYDLVLSGMETGSCDIGSKIRFYKIFTHHIFDCGKKDLIKKYIGIMAQIDKDKAIFEERIQKLSDWRDTKEMQIELEKLLSHLLLRHVIPQAEKGDLWTGIMDILVVYLSYQCYCLLYSACNEELPPFEERILFLSAVSRNMEHSGASKEDLIKEMKNERMAELDNILKMVN